MNCLKCGRTVPDTVLLCPECLQVKKRPTAQAKPQPMGEELWQELLEKYRRRLRRVRRWLGAFVLGAVAAALLLAGSWYYLQEQNDRLNAQTSRINSLETAMQELQKELEQANALNKTAQDALTDAQRKLDAYEAYTGLTGNEVYLLPPQD